MDDAAPTSLPFHAAGEMAARIAAHDWQSTALGPVETWSQRLLAATQLMLANPQIASLAVGPDRLFLYNDTASRLYGDRHPVVLGQPLAEAFPHEFEQVAPFYDRAFAGESLHIPAQPLDPAQTGTADVFDAFLIPVRDADGQVLAVAMTGSAITGRLRADAAIRNSEARLRALVGTGAMTVYRMSPDWRLMYELESADFLARTQEPIERWADHYILPDDRPMVFAAIAEAIAGRTTFDLEHRVRLADGSVGWVASRAVPMFGPDGAITEWFGSANDITERRRTQAALRASEQKYRTSFDSIDQAFCTIEMLYDERGRPVDYRVLEFNAAFEKQTGLKDATGKRMREIAPDHEEFWYEVYGRIALTGQPERFEHEAAALGRWYNVYAFRLDKEKSDRVAVLFDDITARKTAATALLESQARLAAAFESVPVGVAVIDNAGEIVIANAEYRRFLPNGIIPSRDPENGWRWSAWDDAGERLDPRNYPGARAMRGDHVVPGQEMLFTNDAGAQIWTRVASVPVVDAEGKITAQASVISDVDALKRNSEALRESEERKAFLLGLADLMRAQCSADAIIAVATQMLGEHFAASRVVFAEIDDPAGVARIRFGWTAGGAEQHPPVLRLSDFDGPLLEQLRAGMTVRYDDVGSPPYARADMAALAAIGIKAGLSVPLVIAGRFVVNINVHQDRPRQWTPAEIALLEEAAERVWAAVERARAESALRISEERLRHFGDATQDILWIRDATTLQWVYLTPAFERIYGLSRDIALAGDTYRNWQDLIVPEDRNRAVEAIERVRSGEPATLEYRVRRPCDGAIRWLRDTDFPIFDDTGAVALIGGIGHDLTEFRETEMRFKALVEKMPQLVWRAADGGAWTWASPQWTEYTGQDAAEANGWGWLAALHPDDRDAARAAWSRAPGDGGFEVEYRIRCQGGDGYRWFQTRATAVRDPAGIIIEWLGTSTDVHELRGLQDLQKTLLAELQHRVRNILAVTRSIIGRSDNGERDTADYVQHLQGRIAALARTQVLLTRRAGAGIDLEDLIRDELSVQAASDEQFRLSGPAVQLSPKAAEVLTLAVHELATNATKYGAFSHSGGRLDVNWQVEVRDDRRWLSLDWTERGTPIAAATPGRRGFGTELVSRRIPYELKGHGQIELRPEGLASHIAFPLGTGDSILQTDGVSA